MQGKIIKGIAGFYYVHTKDEVIYECKAKGIFRNKKIKPLVGDNVILEIINETEKTGNIVEILERKNQLIRPAVANIDQAIIIFATENPTPNFNLLDRFLILMEKQGVPTIICFNKTDLVDKEQTDILKNHYINSGYQVEFISVKSVLDKKNSEEKVLNPDNEGSSKEKVLKPDNEKNSEEEALNPDNEKKAAKLYNKTLELDNIKKLLNNKTTVLAGPSGVGKSSLINFLKPEANMEVGDISKKIKRGKHTTRHSEFFAVSDKTYILDTPGFSSIALDDVEAESLKEYFPEFELFKADCKFKGCMHIKEKECGIKDALEKKQISDVRYENYIAIYEELKQRKKY